MIDRSSWWVTTAIDSGGHALLVSWVVWVLIAIVLHELAHGWAAIRCGDTTPIETGHMTWNPMVHMGPWSLLVFALIGIAWGLMPVNPSRFRRRHDDALVAAAGPAMNLLLAVVCIVAGSVWIALAGGHWFGLEPVQEPLRSNLEMFFRIGVTLNVVLMLFNLLPIAPLDGGRILASFVPSYERLFQSEQGQWIGLGVLLLAFFYAWRFVFPAAHAVADTGTRLVLSVIAPGAV